MVIFPLYLDRVSCTSGKYRYSVTLNLWRADLGPLLSSSEVLSHQYVNDTQAYTHGQAAEATSMVQMLLDTSLTLETPTKPSLFDWLGSPIQLSKIDAANLHRLFSLIHFYTLVYNLGVTLECELTLQGHVNNVCCICFYHLHKIHTIRCSLLPQASITLVHALTCSAVEFGNSFVSLGSSCISRLQSV